MANDRGPDYVKLVTDLLRDPQRRPYGIAVLIVLLLVALGSWYSSRAPSGPATTQTAGPGEYLFCFWNVENLFDDQDDQRKNPGDDRYDPWFARDAAALNQKLDRISGALLALNNGRGPDIIAVCEVEGERAAQLLRARLNAQLPKEAAPYHEPLCKDIAGGRHIAPAIITRLDAIRDKTRTHGNRLRILEVHLQAAGQPLIVIASHWTSRLSDKTGDNVATGRPRYADQIYGVVNGMVKTTPDVPVIVCGDFNDGPTDASVTEHLRATGDRAALRSGGELRLFNVSADLAKAGKGTHYHEGKWYLFDQIVVTPGLLGSGRWQCDPSSFSINQRTHKPSDKVQRPWSFGGERTKSDERGYADHFAVTVKLKVS
jgi:endonuclease/exonuclease/phosphatase family metal-dependent hydrolase